MELTDEEKTFCADLSMRVAGAYGMEIGEADERPGELSILWAIETAFLRGKQSR